MKVCQVCGSDRIEISLPAWFDANTLEQTGVDDEADVMYTFCRQCDEARRGDWTVTPPPWEVLTEWTDGDYPVTWEYRYLGDGESQHRITYGKEAKETTSDTEAAREFGSCVRHSLECIGAFSEGPR